MIEKVRRTRPLRAALALLVPASIAFTALSLHGSEPKREAGTIVTVAGVGKSGPAVDGGPATAAPLNYCLAVASDAAGNLYIADAGNHRVRMVDRNGIITTIAGTGEKGYAGDGGPAKQARLNFPSRLAFAGDGSLYIGDIDNHAVRKVAPDGLITTVAGTGKRGYSGDGGPGNQAMLDTPVGVAVDRAGNLFITDTGNHRVRRVDTQGTIGTVAGTGKPGSTGDGGPATEAQLGSPIGLTVDGEGNLLIPEGGGVRKVDHQGIIRTVAGGGSLAPKAADGGKATAARLDGVFGVVADTAGNLFLAEWGAHRVRKVSPDGVITTVAGNGSGRFSGEGGSATATGLLGPNGVGLDSEGNLLIVQCGLHQSTRDERVLKVFGVAGPGLLAGQPFPKP